MNKTPHLVIGNKLHDIKQNCIVLSDQKIIHDRNKKKQTIYYNNIEIGENIVLSHKVDKYLNLRPQSTKGNHIYILCKYEDTFTKEGSIFYSEKGNLINNTKVSKPLNTFILSAVIINNKRRQSSETLLSEEEIQLVKKTSYNQVKQTNIYHFDTKGCIYGFGYSVKYDKKILTKIPTVNIH